MSFILNALRKSEQERQSRQTETLEKKILETPVIEQKRTSIWIISLVIINVLLLVYVIWFFRQGDTKEIIRAKEVVATKIEIKEKIKDEVKEPLPKVKKSKIEKIPISISEQLKPKKIINQQVEHKINEPHSVQTSSTKEESVRHLKSVIEPELIKVSKNNERAVNKENELPFLSELDYQFRRAVPEIEINVYVYSEKEKDRFIMIDMKKYVPGQHMKPDMELKKIRMNGIVVEYKNRVFQIKRK